MSVGSYDQSSLSPQSKINSSRNFHKERSVMSASRGNFSSAARRSSKLRLQKESKREASCQRDMMLKGINQAQVIEELLKRNNSSGSGF